MANLLLGFLTLVLLNKMMPHPFLIFRQSDDLIHIAHINSRTEWQTVQIQISWLLQKQSELDRHCLQRQGLSEFSRTRVKLLSSCLKLSARYQLFSYQCLVSIGLLTGTRGLNIKVLEYLKIILGQFSPVLHKNVCCGYSCMLWVLIRSASARHF